MKPLLSLYAAKPADLPIHYVSFRHDGTLVAVGLTVARRVWRPVCYSTTRHEQRPPSTTRWETRMTSGKPRITGPDRRARPASPAPSLRRRHYFSRLRRRPGLHPGQRLRAPQRAGVRRHHRMAADRRAGDGPAGRRRRPDRPFGRAAVPHPARSQDVCRGQRAGDGAGGVTTSICATRSAPTPSRPPA